LIPCEQNRFDAWIRNVDCYPGNDLLYFNPNGIIPPEAAIKKGDNRSMPFRERKVFDTTDFSKSVKIDLEQEVEAENNQGSGETIDVDEKTPGADEEEA
jgi:tRNA pseudouridine38-40 synthase